MRTTNYSLWSLFSIKIKFYRRIQNLVHAKSYSMIKCVSLERMESNLCNTEHENSFSFYKPQLVKLIKCLMEKKVKVKISTEK